MAATEKLNICVNGSRGFNDLDCMDRHLRYHILEGTENNYRLIVGGAKGADTLAREWAIKNGVEFLEMPADWNKFGKSAGYRRNVEMINISQMLISFWDDQSKGTKHTIDYATEKGVKTQVIHYLDPGY
jgi:hypothetical protein